jgi:hypothetical protein
MENQHDAHYMELRSRARQEGDAMARAFDESHAAYAAGDGARAHELSEQGKRHQHDMERLNGEASQWIFVSEWFFLSFFMYRTYTDNPPCRE